MRVKTPGRAGWMDLEVIDAHPPWRSTEESVGARGRRRTRGTYTLEELAEGGTRITFELEWLRMPLSERLAAPLTRGVVRRSSASRSAGSRSTSRINDMGTRTVRIRALARGRARAGTSSSRPSTPSVRMSAIDAAAVRAAHFDHPDITAMSR